MENERGNRSLTWDETISIKAFKRDLYAVDRICLGLELKDGSGVELDEEMAGWDSLVQKLPEYLPGCKRFGEWFENSHLATRLILLFSWMGVSFRRAALVLACITSL